MNAWRLLSVTLFCVATCQSGTVQAISNTEREFFETRIRPVLVEHCYQCHNSAETAEGGLVVDHRSAIQRGGDGGVVIVAGKPNESRLIMVLRHQIEDLEMPEGGPKLEDAVVADFEKWIQMGAPDPRDSPPTQQQIQQATSWEQTLERRKKWWSFQPIAMVELPGADGANKNPIDRLIGHALESANLAASPTVDSPTLVRRLYFSLTGLPPTADEAIEWTREIDAAASQNMVIEQLIDELLRSPRFGERWARHWMDWIRYAESHGSEGDPKIENAWMYRDYLIRALNQDVPYNQLLKEHVAGDLMPSPRINTELGINESVIGTAHWRMVFHGFAPTDALDEKVRFIDDQINVFSKAFMGLTVSCARCHDHKFDAVSQADYYALFGVLASCRPGRNVVDVPSKQYLHRDSLTKLKSQIKDVVATQWLSATDLAAKRLLSANSNSAKAGGLAAAFFEIRKKVDEGNTFQSAWNTQIELQSKRLETVTSFANQPSEHRWDLANHSDQKQWHSFGVGLEGESDAGQFSIATDGDGLLQGIYPSGIYSHGISTKHPGRLTSPDFLVDKDSTLWVQATGGDDSSLRYVVQDYPRSGTVYPVTKLQDSWRWQRFDIGYWNGESVHIELTTAMDAPLLTASKPRSWFGVRRAIVTDKNVQTPPAAVEALLPIIQATAETPPKDLTELSIVLQSVIGDAIEAWKNGSATDSQALLLHECLSMGALSNSIAAIPAVADLVKKYRAFEAEIPVPLRVPGLEEFEGSDQALMIRGNHKRLGEVIPRRFLEAIDRTAYLSKLSGRMELAEDLVRDDNPLTKRVIVNRIWHHLFGRGIVSTPDNFGRLGNVPSNPELLDWLATRFARDGWSMKKMIRLIVTSDTWQRSSHPQPGVAQADPENRLFAHMNVRRLEAESIRDSLLAVSGRLENQLYGSPVATSSPRRSVYVKVVRNALDPFLRAFDFPEPFSSVGKRDVTNVPAQSLAMMNDALVAGYANDWAKRTLEQSGLESNQQRVTQMFIDAFGRSPSGEEIDRSLNFLQQTRLQVSQHAQARDALKGEIEQIQSCVDGRLKLARESMAEPNPLKQEAASIELPPPISEWDFVDGMDDRIGKLNLALKGGAVQNDNGLVVRSGGHAVSDPLSSVLVEKTMEVWVKLDTLDQRGGGVMTIQTPDGRLFDSIVFAEKDARQWLSGSNNFSRTESFGGELESEASEHPVHLAITYHADGTITGYRNGKRYGESYKSSGPLRFEPNNTIVSFGVRHLPAGGNRLLAGAILKARLYGTALTAEQIAASVSGSKVFVPDRVILEQLPKAEREKIVADRLTLSKLTAKLQTLPESKLSETQQAWAELARAMFCFKEFIYVR